MKASVLSTAQELDGLGREALLAEIDEELGHHLACLVDELTASGMDLPDALLEAERRLGPRQRLRMACLRQRQSSQRTMNQRIQTLLLIGLLAAVVTLALQNQALAERSTRTQEDLDAQLVQVQEMLGKLAVAPELKPRGQTEAAPALTPAEDIKDWTVEAALERFLNSRDGVGGRALRALGSEAIPAVAAVATGRHKLDDSTAGMKRFLAANILGDTRDPAAIPYLLEALEDSYFNVRRCAALALAKCVDPEVHTEAVEALQELANEDPFRWRASEGGEWLHLVRDDASTALNQLGL